MSESREILTLEAFAALPEEPWRAELVRGLVAREPPAGFEHGWITARLGALLDEHLRASGTGAVVAAETGFVLEEDPPTVRAPDVALVTEGRIPPPGERAGFVRGAPDLAVEIVSPSNTASEVQEKVVDYLRAGCRLVWVVDPRTRSVTAYESPREIRLLREGEALDGGGVLPGLSLPVEALFPD